MRRRGHHLQIAIQMLDVRALRVLGFFERLDRLLGTDAPKHSGADEFVALVHHRLDVQVQFDGPQIDDSLVRKLMPSGVFLGAQDLVDPCRILVHQVDRLADELVHRKRQMLLKRKQGFARRFVDVAQDQIAIAKHDIGRQRIQRALETTIDLEIRSTFVFRQLVHHSRRWSLHCDAQRRLRTNHEP